MKAEDALQLAKAYTRKTLAGGGAQKGEKGDPGKDGKSAYQIWLDAGNVGDEAEFLESIKGEPGKDGAPGSKGEKGDKGDTGATGAKGEKGDTGATGQRGPAGENGSDASVTTENIKTALGYTPADETKVSQLSEDIKEISNSEDTLVENRIPLDDTMKVGKVMQQGTLDTNDTNYMYTERIYLGDTKSFEIIAVNANGITISPGMRYVTAYDSNGNVKGAYSLQNIAESTELNRKIVMDNSVDSVIITIYKAFEYTEKTVITTTSKSIESISLKTEKLSGFQITFTDDEVCQGNYKGGIADFTDKRSICTRGFVKPFVAKMNVTSENIQVAVVMYNKGAYVRTDLWNANGLSYVFDHKKYQYKLYMTNKDNSYIHDYEGMRKSITLDVSTSDILYAYNTMEAEYSAVNERMKKMLESTMRRNYNISYANAPEANGLIAYTGNNQIVHPKVLYFPEKFGGHRYWMAYTPYPWAIDLYENPCIAYSDDGYEWTNIPGNPLDDPEGDGYNSDTHLVYIEDTKTLEVWYRYVGNYDNEVVEEIIYRQTTKDGINWTEKEIVINNVSGNYVQYLSPAIIHDGEKYKMWVVNGNDRSIRYYETTDLSSFNEIRTINIDFTDEDNTFRPWHIDVIEDNGQTILLCMAKTTASAASEQKWTLFIATSTDNEIFSIPTAVIRGNPYGWDEQIYRSSIVNVDGEYRIYYSAQNKSQKHGLGISTSDTLSNFVGKL